ncbi:MAG: iron-sulfur cluster assembly scaffold protein [Spirochaetaceae bacterium]|nr:iron-sulfur cluster assembly scaffold protein [Spirochaetaceae bacterium]
MGGPDWVYTETVKDHFINPRNILTDEAEFNADGSGTVGSMACGDEMLVAIKVENDSIADCKWKTYGCASAIASTSMLSVFAKGMSLAEAYKITPADITDQLGGLPNHKFHCSVLGDRALRAAIDDYLEKQGRDNPFKAHTAKIICECKEVTDQDIEDQVKRGVSTYEELQEKTEIGTVCGKCKEKTLELLHEYNHMYGGIKS